MKTVLRQKNAEIVFQTGDMTRCSKPALSSQSCQGIYGVANASIGQSLPSCAVRVVWKMVESSPVEEVHLCQARLEIHLSIVLSKSEAYRVIYL